MSQIHWITPNLPTRLDNFKTMPLPGTDQTYFPVTFIHHVPGALSVDRLKEAIAQVLSIYPHAAGRLQRNEDNTVWEISLSRSPVPLTVVEAFPNQPVPTSQEIVSGYQPILDPPPWMFEPPVDAHKYPLIRWKLTRYSFGTITRMQRHESILVVHACHVLGDGSLVRYIQQTLSDLYQNPNGTPSVPLPTFENYWIAAERSRKSSPDISKARQEVLKEHLFDLQPAVANRTSSQDLSLKETEMQMQKWIDSTEAIQYQFSAEQMDLLQRIAMETQLPPFQTPVGGKQERLVRVSKADAILAYMFTVFNRVYPEKFDRLVNVIGYRGRKSSEPEAFPPSTSAGNLNFQVILPLKYSIPRAKQLDVGYMALVFRRMTLKFQHDHEFVKDAVRLNEYELDASQNDQAGSSSRWKPLGPGVLGANLLHHTPVHHAHFGFGPSKVRFWAHPSVPHYIRMFPANPEPLAEADSLDTAQAASEWQPAPKGAVSVVLRVEKQYAKSMMDVVKMDMEEMEVRNRALREPVRPTGTVDVWKRVPPRPDAEVHVPALHRL
ncbi:hypothetical protein D9758_010677 [Tetrapyrgos nigripes]|uniref:Uncharacterized protein n=1 Tax=Tetrapyrgos nigripes TaxID=182062 RepID=A0A8H5GG88_9AGAR|nr:hypothetical protein D9758_010677 [Tetrapyrgos nigripes]